MGVSWLIPWELPSGKNGQQAVEMLHKRAELLGAQKTGNWSLDCETYYAISILPSSSKLMHLVHSTEFPYTSFAVLETGTCLVAETGFDSLLVKLKSFYNPRKAAKIEAKGQRYEYGDFILKFGQVSIGPSFKGVVIEIEYVPCLEVEQCEGLMREFLTSFMDATFTMPPEPPQTSNKVTGLFTPSDVVLQYVDVFNSYKKAQGGP